MDTLQIAVHGANAVCTNDIKLTGGMVGLPCAFSFDASWDGLARTAVFRAGDTAIRVLLTGDTCDVPHEVMENTHYKLEVGLYGVNADGKTVILPSIYADCGTILEGAALSADEGEAPTPTLVEQILSAAGAAAETANAVKAAAEAGDFNGKDGKDGRNGDKGDKGDAGYTPVRGSDYWTEDDVAAIHSYIDNKLGVIEYGSY